MLLPDLRARLRQAVREAQEKAERAPTLMAEAPVIAARGLARSLRVARRSTVETAVRFELREVCVPEVVETWVSACAAVRHCWPNSERVAAALQGQPLPLEPPAPEEGTRGAVALPKARQAWEAEKTRQTDAPFVAGGREVSFTWAREPPEAAPGKVWCWGQLVAPADEELGVLLAKEARQRAIEAVSWADVDVVTPVLVVRHPVTGKARLVHDLRPLNAVMGSSPVVYERVQDALGRGAAAAKLDLLSAFRHCRLAVRDRRRLGFAVGGIVYRWRVLPFGAAQSPRVFAEALSGAVSRARAEGMELVVYVDDILIVAPSASELDAAVARLFVILREEGWWIALEKAFVRVAAVQIPFLGLDVDLEQQVVRVSVTKAKKLKALCQALLARSTISLRDLQKLGGTLSFLTAAVPEIGLARQAINLATAEAEGLPGRTVGVKGQLKAELQFWDRSALTLPSRAAMRSGEEWTAVVADMAGEPFRGWGAVAWLARREAPDINGWLSAREVRDDEDACAMFGALPSLSAESSAALEVRALREALHYIGRTRPTWLEGRRIAWYCDAQSAVAAVRKWRAKAAGLLREVAAVFAIVRRWKAAVEPFWVARQCGWQPVADFLSRLSWRPATAEWTLPPGLVEEVLRRCRWRPNTDLFATTGNAQFGRAVTRWPTEGFLCDAFARSWTQLRGWAFPPHSQLPRVWRQLMVARDARVLVVMPARSPVPGAVRVVWEMDLPRVPLLDLHGRDARDPMPHRLKVVDARSVDGDP
jgi:hypothetical protein